MNILIVSPHFWPENFPINVIGEHLAKKNKVFVLTGTPHYPKPELFKKYKNFFYIEKYKNIKIIRLPLLIRRKSSFISISLNYLSFILSFFYFKNKIIKNMGSINTILNYGVSPITSAIPCIYLKKKFKCKFIIWVQDIWPESVKSTGYIKNKYIYSFIKKISNFIYSSADLLLVQSKGFEKILRNRNFKKIKLFYNCYNPPKYKNLKKHKKIVNILKKYFCITYMGNLGTAQKFDTLIKTAIKLKHKNNIKFLLIGEGSQKVKLEKEIKKHKINNIYIFNQVEKDCANTIQKNSKILFLSLKKSFIFKNTIPSKFQQYISIGTPIIGELEGVSKDLLIKSKCGYVIKYNSVNNFVNTIYKIYYFNRNKLSVIRKNGINYFNNNFNIKNNIKKLENEIKKN